VVATTSSVSVGAAVAVDSPGTQVSVSVSIAGTDAREFASASEVSSASLVSVPSIVSVDEDTTSVDIPVVSASQSSAPTIDTQTIALDGASLSEQSAPPITGDADTDKFENGTLAESRVTVQPTTDNIEITSALVVFSPQSTDVTPIISGDEETSASEGRVLSALRGDDIVADVDTRASETPTIQPANATITEPFVTLEANDFSNPEPVTVTVATADASILLLPLHVTAVAVEQREALGSLEVASAITTVLPTAASTVPIVVEDGGAISLEEDAIVSVDVVSIASTFGAENVVRKDEQTGGTISSDGFQTSSVIIR